VFIAGVVDSGDKLFTGVNDTCDMLSPVTLLFAINIVTGSYAFLQNFIDFMNLASNIASNNDTRDETLAPNQLAVTSK
jgi:hypothetical protein